MKKEIVNEKLSIQLKGNQHRKGKIHTVETRQNISLHNKGYHWFNNAHIEIKAKECPDGFVKGRLQKIGHWYTNFEQNVWATEKPEGKRWIQGRASYNEGKHWVNDGTHNFLLEKITPEDYAAGVRFGIIRKAKTVRTIPRKPIRTTTKYVPPVPKKWVPDNTPVEPLHIVPLKVSIVDKAIQQLKKQEQEYHERYVINRVEDTTTSMKSTVSANELLSLLEHRTPSVESLALLSRYDN